MIINHNSPAVTAYSNTSAGSSLQAKTMTDKQGSDINVIKPATEDYHKDVKLNSDQQLTNRSVRSSQDSSRLQVHSEKDNPEDINKANLDNMLKNQTYNSTGKVSRPAGTVSVFDVTG